MQHLAALLSTQKQYSYLPSPQQFNEIKTETLVWKTSKFIPRRFHEICGCRCCWHTRCTPRRLSEISEKKLEQNGKASFIPFMKQSHAESTSNLVIRNFLVTLNCSFKPNVSYPCKVNWHLVTGNGSLTQICSLSNRSLSSSLTVWRKSWELIQQ